MNKHLAAYLAAAVVMIALDIVWLGWVATAMYQSAIGHLMAERPGLGAAAVFYLGYPAGLIVFTVANQRDGTGWPRSLAFGALFGLVAYGTYDLSNLATLKDWPVRLTVIDMAWGTVASAAAAAAGRVAMIRAART